MSSPFASKLRTNYCPTDGEAAEITALLDEPVLQLKGLDDKIAELQKTIDKLAAQRNTLHTYIAEHRALISLVRRLPLEILEEIFSACLPTHRNCVMSTSEAPLLLGRVCSSWRAISLSTPRLWSKLHIVEPTTAGWWPNMEEEVAKHLEATKTWLARSGQCPLSISLESGNEGGPTVSNAHSFFEALVPFAPRWQHMQFATAASILRTMSHLTEADVPLLETLAFYTHPLHGSYDIVWGSLGIVRGPRVSSFSVPAYNFTPSEIPLRWHQLTTLWMGGQPWSFPLTMTSELLLETLTSCPQLRCCKLRVVDTSITFEDHPMLELPFLYTLELDCGGRVDATLAILVWHLSLPRLRTFTLHAQGSTILDERAPSLVYFFALWTQLETVEIQCDRFSQSTLVDSLRSLPAGVRRLTIHDSHGVSANDEALAAVTALALEELVLTNCDLISDTALLRFITTRMSEDHFKFRRVEALFRRRKTLDILTNLKPFVDSGRLKVSVTYPPSLYSPWEGAVHVERPPEI
ncbi:hypothetical protein B0H16DRAFT_1519365 [Mycena metata]|uniref:F-box domain-containing protein n=1 Tax=Mycena metata TaxID=1033252 RepID=A0AAD7NNB7_9AGAR|nr:hypothetical protein B0H16DRAFT_1519365 [Mycena metata]